MQKKEEKNETKSTVRDEIVLPDPGEEKEEKPHNMTIYLLFPEFHPYHFHHYRQTQEEKSSPCEPNEQH